MIATSNMMRKLKIAEEGTHNILETISNKCKIIMPKLMLFMKV